MLLRTLIFCSLFVGSFSGIAQNDSLPLSKEQTTQLRTWEPMMWPESKREDIIKATYMLYENRFEIKNEVVPGKWTELGPAIVPDGPNLRQVGIGRVNTVIFRKNDEQKMFVCSPTGGMYYSENGGESWQNGGTDFLPVAAAAWVLPDARNENRWVLASGDGDGDWTPSAGVFITQDKGKNYTNISEGLPFPTATWDALRITKLAAHPLNLKTVYAATNKGLYVCDDVWSEKPKWRQLWAGQFNDIEFKPNRPTEIWAAGEVIVRSENSGKSWREVPGTSFAQIGYQLIKTNLEMTPADNGVVYAAVTGIDPKKGTYKAKVYAYHDSTRTWEFRSEVADQSYMAYGLIPGRDKAFVVSPTDPNVIYAANVNPIFRSNDGARTWQRMGFAIHDDIHHLQFSDRGKTLWATNDGGIYKSTDGGHNWVNKTNGIGVANILGMSISEETPNKVVVGTYDTGSSLLDKTSGTWKWKTGGDGYGNMFDPRSDETYYTTAVTGTVWRFDKDGKKTVSAPRSGSDWQTWVDRNPANPDVIYQCGRDLWRSNDRGNPNTWESILDVNGQFPGYKKVIRVYPAPKHPDVVYAVLIGKYPVQLIQTKNANAPAGEVVWKAIDHPENAWIIDMTIDEEDANEIWIAYGKVGGGFTDKIWYYDGSDWKNMAWDLPEFATVTSIALEHGSDGRVYVGTNAGVYFTDHRCKKWFLLQGLPHCHTRLIRINQTHNFLVAGTFGRGVWQCELPKEMEPPKEKGRKRKQ